MFLDILRMRRNAYQDENVLRIIKRRPFGCKFLAWALEKKGAPVMDSTKYIGYLDTDIPDLFRSVHCDRSFRLERPTLKTFDIKVCVKALLQ